MISSLRIILGTLALLTVGGTLVGCQSTYYSAMEQVGIHKRDILVDRVDSAKASQEDAQEQFKTALEQYRSVVSFNGGELESMYDKLKAEYEGSVNAAKDVSDRIEKVEHVAEALFEEWQEELNLYTNATLRRQSERQLKDTSSRYKSLIQAMKRAESRMQPVLSALQDNVLFLKHNLNAKAIGALKGELDNLRQDTDLMIKEMSAAIEESDRFIAEMKQGH